MELTQVSEGEITIVRLSGSRIDASVAVLVKDELMKLLDDGHDKIALDMSVVEFIDSSGLGAIVSVRKRIGTAGELALFGIQDAVQTMFKLTRMDKVFKMFSDETEMKSALSD